MSLLNLRSLTLNRPCACRLPGCVFAVASLTFSADAYVATARAQDVTLASTAAPAAPEAEAEAEAEEEQPSPMCKTDLRLSGAVFDARRPEHSFAVVQAMQSRSGAVYRVGMWVAGYELVQVAPRGVLLRDRDGECWLQLVGDQTMRPAPARAPARTSKRTAPRKAKKRSEVVVVGQSSR